MDRYLSFLVSRAYPADLAPEHRADLRRSGLTDETVARQRLCSLPPSMIAPLLGFDIAAVRSAMLIPFADPAGGWMDFIRMKIFPSLSHDGHSLKYLQRKQSSPRLFFPLAQMNEALHGRAPLWLVEGEKKALAVAQLGLPAIAFSGVEGWHSRGSQQLLLDFKRIQLAGRVIELVPDGDVATNPHVARGAERYAAALEAHGARVRLVQLPVEVSA